MPGRKCFELVRPRWHFHRQRACRICADRLPLFIVHSIICREARRRPAPETHQGQIADTEFCDLPFCTQDRSSDVPNAPWLKHSHQGSLPPPVEKTSSFHAPCWRALAEPNARVKWIATTGGYQCIRRHETLRARRTGLANARGNPRNSVRASKPVSQCKLLAGGNCFTPVGCASSLSWCQRNPSAGPGLIACMRIHGPGHAPVASSPAY